MSNTNATAMNTEALKNIAALIAAQGITPTAEMVIGLSVKVLVQSGMDAREAFDRVMGGGSFDKLAGMVWDELQAA